MIRSKWKFFVLNVGFLKKYLNNIIPIGSYYTPRSLYLHPIFYKGLCYLHCGNKYIEVQITKLSCGMLFGSFGINRRVGYILHTKNKLKKKKN